MLQGPRVNTLSSHVNNASPAAADATLIAHRRPHQRRHRPARPRLSSEGVGLAGGGQQPPINTTFPRQGEQQTVPSGAARCLRCHQPSSLGHTHSALTGPAPLLSRPPPSMETFTTRWTASAGERPPHCVVGSRAGVDVSPVDHMWMDAPASPASKRQFILPSCCCCTVLADAKHS